MKDGLLKLLANYYSLYVKLHSYHWNVEGANFVAIHTMLEGQYKQIAEEIDEIAEVIRMLGEKVPASLENFSKLSEIKSPNENLNAQKMLDDLYQDNVLLIDMLERLITKYESNTFVVDMLIQRLSLRKKTTWFLKSSL